MGPKSPSAMTDTGCAGCSSTSPNRGRTRLVRLSLLLLGLLWLALSCAGSRSSSQPGLTRVEPERQHSHRKPLQHRQRARRSRAQLTAKLVASGPFEQSGAADRPLVATKKGLVRGISQKLTTGKFVDAFLGVPFAEPPVGRFRFRHPQPIRTWTGERDASRMASSCYQVNDTFFGANFMGTSMWNANTPLSEDCLYLNVWSPFGLANTTSADQLAAGVGSTSSGSGAGSREKRAVLVWIFGGGFYSGTSTLSVYEGGVLASEEDVVLVSMNYRVSSLGFLYFGRPDSPGNAGLFDQLMALQWITDNIHQFGGDPNRVTIFGESAGAVSIALHLLSPLSRNLFNQAILQSGAATNPWGFMEPAEIVSNGLQLASLVNCRNASQSGRPATSQELDQVLECLLKLDPMALVSQEVGRTSSVLNFPFVPVVDGSFLLESPHESLAKSNFKPTRLMLGSNHDEGNSWLIYRPEFSRCPDQGAPEPVTEPTPASSQKGPAPMDSLDLVDAAARQQQQQQQPESQQDSGRPCKFNEAPSLSREDFLRVLVDDLNPYAQHPIAKEAMVFEYTNWNSPQDPASNYDALDKIVGDFYFTCPVNDLALHYAQAGNQVYMYYFRQRASTSPWPKWAGVLHGDEVSFVFGQPLNQVQFNYSAKEIELSRRMMKYWANFAKFGDPVKLAENASMAEKWPEYADKRQYFELHGDYVRLGRGPRAKQCAFWSHYLPKLINSFERNQCPLKVGQPAPVPGRTHSVQLAPDQADFGSDGSQWSVADGSLLSLHQRRHQQASLGLFANIPSLILISLSVILVLTLIGLLLYAKRTWSLDFTLSPSSASSGAGQHQAPATNNNNSSANGSGNDNRRRRSSSASTSNNNNNNN